VSQLRQPIEKELKVRPHEPRDPMLLKQEVNTDLWFRLVWILNNSFSPLSQDFVKISRWNDVSFWSIKQSVEKTHR